MHLLYLLKVKARRLTAAAGTTSSVLGTSSTPSLTMATATYTYMLSATATVILGEDPFLKENHGRTRCKSYRPVSVAVIHHPIHHECGADDLNEEEEEEDQSRPPIPTQVGPTTAPTEPCTSTVTGTPDSAAPITIWRSESPTRKNQDIKVIKKIKKKKEKDKEEEMTDEKTKLKKKVKKGKLTKKKSPMKSESAPPDLSRTLSPRMLARMSESSPESPEDLESEDSYNDRGQQEPSSDDIVESSSPRKREKCIAHVKKNRGKTSPTRKVIKRKSPPMSNPNLS
ncbi:protein PROCA1 isoform X3 [Marmota monax]|uniref:protein PROCA1 isoform X3 n=1 Tax=Marmota monax TaxID=9995 RepID=UPI0026F12E5A|nr:protein PROCA1 isoform X3 [Marmota monax]XP_058436019.1 protein PROCA1 isoform X3 [Marmota monax]